MVSEVSVFIINDMHEPKTLRKRCSHMITVTISFQFSQRIGVIMRLRNLIPTEAELQLYKEAILRHLTHCHLICHFCRASDTRRLEGLQERGFGAVF